MTIQSIYRMSVCSRPRPIGYRVQYETNLRANEKKQCFSPNRLVEWESWVFDLDILRIFFYTIANFDAADFRAEGERRRGRVGGFEPRDRGSGDLWRRVQVLLAHSQLRSSSKILFLCFNRKILNLDCSESLLSSLKSVKKTYEPIVCTF